MGTSENTYLPRRWATVRDSPVMYGKQAAFPRYARWGSRGRGGARLAVVRSCPAKWTAPTVACNDIDPSPYWDFNIAAPENLSAPGSPKVATFGRVGQLHW